MKFLNTDLRALRSLCGNFGTLSVTCSVFTIKLKRGNYGNVWGMISVVIFSIVGTSKIGDSF